MHTLLIGIKIRNTFDGSRTIGNLFQASNSIMRVSDIYKTTSLFFLKELPEESMLTVYDVLCFVDVIDFYTLCSYGGSLVIC